MPKVYNALTMDEFKQTILNEVERVLIKQGIKGIAITLPAARWEWRLEIETLREPSHYDIRARGEIGDTDKLEKAKPAPLILKGGSKRFATDPPSPTEVRKAESLPIPEG